MRSTFFGKLVRRCTRPLPRTQSAVGARRGDILIYILNMSEDLRETQRLIYPRWNFIFKVGREGEGDEGRSKVSLQDRNFAFRDVRKFLKAILCQTALLLQIICEFGTVI